MSNPLSVCLAERVLAYLRTHSEWDKFDKERAIREAVDVLCNDIGAAQDFLVTIGVEIDLYAEPDRSISD
jgi:hypothetical protein